MPDSDGSDFLVESDEELPVKQANRLTKQRTPTSKACESDESEEDTEARQTGTMSSDEYPSSGEGEEATEVLQLVFGDSDDADDDEEYCQVCLGKGHADKMLLCDDCNKGFHIEHPKYWPPA